MDKPCKKTWRALGSDGYPIIAINGRNVRLARYVYEKHHKTELSSDEVIMHICDNPRCVEITHLVRGTELDNVKDMMAKQRHAKGTGKSNAKLTEKDIPVIRDLYDYDGWSQQRIADKYGVDQSIISEIITERLETHMRTTCDWCGSTKSLAEYPFKEQGGGVETICFMCFANSFRCTICEDLSSIVMFGKLSDPAQPDDICNDCYTKMQDAVRVLEGMKCVCGRVIDPESACMELRIASLL